MSADERAKRPDVATNSGWGIDEETETTPGDYISTPPALSEAETPEADVLAVVELPTASTSDTDPGDPPACAFCNGPTHIQERKLESQKVGGDWDGIIRADYGLLDMDRAQIVCYCCHACIAEAPEGESQ